MEVDDDDLDLRAAKARLFARDTVRAQWHPVTGLPLIPQMVAEAEDVVERRVVMAIDGNVSSEAIRRVTERVFREWWKERSKHQGS